jgi:hypothetical protein
MSYFFIYSIYISHKEIPDEDIGFPKEIKEALHDYGKIKREGKIERIIGVPAHVKAAKYSNKYLGTRYDKGSKPMFMYIKAPAPGFPDTDVVAFEKQIPNGFIPNYKIIREKMFKNKLDTIFQAAGFGDFPELQGGQQSLF